MARIITDLHGDTYKVGDFHLRVDFPNHKKAISYSYNRDIITNKTFNIIKCKDKTYGVLYNHNMRLFIEYELTFISHDDLKDIRKGYIYGNIYHS